MRSPRLVVVILSLLLLASLGANVFLGGLALGHAAKPVHEVISLGPNFKALIASLPEPDRQLMHKNFEEHKQDVQAANEAARKSADAVRAALIAEPYDQKQLEAALADYHRDFVALRGKMQDIFWQGAEQLSPEGRAKIADSAVFKKDAGK